jgi:CBS domain-containing protein
MKVGDVMTRDVQVCHTRDRLDCPARIMWEQDVGCVPVLDRDLRLAGMVTDRDICMAAYTQGLLLAAIPVTVAMAHDVASCRAGDELAAAERTMQQRQVRRLPVVDDAGRVVGILSLNDLARAAAGDRLQPTRLVGTDEVLVTLARIGEPRQPGSRAGASAPSQPLAAPPRNAPGRATKGRAASSGA